MARMKQFRCMNQKCQAKNDGRFESESDEPTCSQCNIGKDHPRFGKMILRVAEIHFDPPSEVPGYGLGFRACNPKVPIGVPINGLKPVYHGGTGDPTIVN